MSEFPSNEFSTDTPLTEAHLAEVYGGADSVPAVALVDADFARGLERKLIAVRTCLGEAMAHIEAREGYGLYQTWRWHKWEKAWDGEET